MAASLTVNELRSRLDGLGLDSRGNKADLRNKLKKALKRPVGSSNGESASTSKSEPWSPKYHSFLVLDVEATCEHTRRYGPDHKQYNGTRPYQDVRNHQYPSEIIEFPLILLQWNTEQQSLEQVDIFHTYVQPTYRPKLSKFCQGLTGIKQDQVDTAPQWNKVVEDLCAFLLSHNLLEQRMVKGTDPYSYRLKRGVTWLTHGPADLRDFVLKTCWISKSGEGQFHGTPPMFLRGPLLDVRLAIQSLYRWENDLKRQGSRNASSRASPFPEFGGTDGFQVVAAPTAEQVTPEEQIQMSRLSDRDGTVVGLLDILGIGPFQGKQHCGLDDARNIARIAVEIVRRISEAFKGHQILLNRKYEAADGHIESYPAILQLDSRSGPRRARGMEQILLYPNIRTEDVHRRWLFTGKFVGDVKWPFLPDEEIGACNAWNS